MILGVRIGVGMDVDVVSGVGGDDVGSGDGQGYIWAQIDSCSGSWINYWIWCDCWSWKYSWIRLTT